MKKKVVNKDVHITVYSPGWWFYVVMTAAGLIVLTVYGRKLDYDQRINLILYLSIFELILLRIYKHSLKYIRTDYNYYNELPCYLCNQSTIMCILAALLRNSQIMSYCFSIGTFGALLAVFMPDSHNRDQLFFSKQAVGFYGYHGLLIITCLSFFTMGVYEPVLADSLSTMAIVVILVGTAHIVNKFLRYKGLNPTANYDYTIDPEIDMLKKLYSFNPKEFYYLFPILPVFGLISFVLLFICRFL